MSKVEVTEWKWFGHAGHSWVGDLCQFHLCTQVGEYLVSTVGLYLPDEGVREILAETRGVELCGRGDERLRDYMKKIGFEDLAGAGQKFETMVFEAGLPCVRPECGCGLPEVNGCELDSKSYALAGEATTGHMEMCRKWVGVGRGEGG